jgi:hypothetical protein
MTMTALSPVRRASLVCALLSVALGRRDLVAQDTACASAPPVAAVVLSDTTRTVERDISVKSGACRGIATLIRVSAGFRFRVHFPPCASGDPWRTGADYTTMASAMRAAARPPACPPIVVPPPPVDTTPPPPPIDTTPVPPPVSFTSFLESFTGQPATPLPFVSANWHKADMSSWDNTWVTPTPSVAQHHGETCAGPPATHIVSTYEQHAFLCRDHMMTALGNEEYAALVLTSDRMAVIDDSVTIISVAVNDSMGNDRDWWRLWISPWDDALQMPASPTIAPGLNGNPRFGLWIENSKNGVNTAAVGNHADIMLAQPWRPLSELKTLSFSRRVPHEIRITRTRVQVRMIVNPAFPDSTLLMADNPINLPAGPYVVQLAHYSYNPLKSGMPNPQFNTWHWDEFFISRALPFTIINSSPRAAVSLSTTTPTRITFTAPAPTGARLLYTASGHVTEISFDNGASWIRPARAPFVPRAQAKYDAQYRTAIPAGTTSLLVRGGPVACWTPTDCWPGNKGWTARDFTIWSR